MAREAQGLLFWPLKGTLIKSPHSHWELATMTDLPVLTPYTFGQLADFVCLTINFLIKRYHRTDTRTWSFGFSSQSKMSFGSKPHWRCNVSFFFLIFIKYLFFFFWSMTNIITISYYGMLWDIKIPLILHFILRILHWVLFWHFFSWHKNLLVWKFCSSCSWPLHLLYVTLDKSVC